jgi:NADH-ubiquinone oxidoreductase chain 6
MNNIFSIEHYLFNGFFINFLNVICFVAFFAGVLTITTKNPVVSVLFLILLFGCIAAFLIFVGLKFIGLSYLLVYVGAVSILFLFILMLINIRVSELISDTSNNIPVAILAILTIFVPFSHVLEDNTLSTGDVNLTIFDNISVMLVSSESWDSNISEISDIISIGNVMYTTFSIWLIIASIILLLAMVGSIVITIKQKN